MNVNEAQQILDGVMLSDGAFRKPRRPTHNSYFYLCQSHERLHLDWILQVKIALEMMGLNFSDSTPHIGQKCTLWSKYSLRASVLYHRWYPERTKIVPTDLALTPISVANWFMGDGTSSWVRGNLVTANFATHSFKPLEAQRLADLLVGQGVDAHPAQVQGYPVVYITTIDGVCSLMNLVEPHILPSYSYKIKRPRRKNDYPRRTRRKWEVYLSEKA